MILYPHLLKNVVHPNPYYTAFWKAVLERVSIGEAPFGTHRVQNRLVYRKSYVSLEEATHDEVVDFFVSHIGLQLQYVHYATWKEIKRKVIKDNLIQDFVSRSQAQYGLETRETQQLLSMIHLYLTIKRILPHEIQLETYPHMHIVSIEGVTFKAGKYTYTSLADRDSVLSDTDEDEDLLESEDTTSEDEFTQNEEIDEDDSIE
jgi:hypothetical protein